MDICVTRQNQESPWLNFEAGALAKRVDQAHVVPLAIDLVLTDIRNPLAQFQAQLADEEGIRKLLDVINSVSQSLTTEHLRRAVATWWPQLDAELERVKQESPAQADAEHLPRSDRELLEEILETVRGIARPLDYSDWAAVVALSDPQRSFLKLPHHGSARTLFAELSRDLLSAYVGGAFTLRWNKRGDTVVVRAVGLEDVPSAEVARLRLAGQHLGITVRFEDDPSLGAADSSETDSDV